jgi:hypothetical protein
VEKESPTVNRVRKIARRVGQLKRERTQAKNAQRARTAENKRIHRPSKMATLLLLLVGLILVSACKSDPVPGRVALAGDSLTFQAGYYVDGFAGFDQDGKVGLGWQTETAQPRVTSDVEGAATSPQILVMAFGQNDAGSGLDATDRAQIRALALSPAEQGTCTVMVKPWYIGTDPVRAQGIADYRAYVDQLVAENQAAVAQAQAQDFAGDPHRIVSVDWQPDAVTPGALDPDGFHLTAEVGAPLYNALIRSAPDAC